MIETTLPVTLADLHRAMRNLLPEDEYLSIQVGIADHTVLRAPYVEWRVYSCQYKRQWVGRTAESVYRQAAQWLFDQTHKDVQADLDAIRVGDAPGVEEVWVQFSHGEEDRISQPFGPYRWAQCKYDTLVVQPLTGDEVPLACCVNDGWHLIGNLHDETDWSDMHIMSGKPE